MEDREIVAAVVAGDPAGLAAAYDRYAAALFTYCRTMLRESADASDVVQDTFVIASTRLSQLRDPSKLRTWLYAVARNECYRRLRGKEAPGLDEVPEVTDESEAVGAQAERVQLQQLVHDALIGMNIGDREVIELMIRHDFEGPELSEALGVTRNHAHAMLSRARIQLKTSLGALLVARTGRGSCETLDEMLAHWDGTMNVLLRKQINRHIENCDICSERRRRELAPAALFSLLPLAALPPGLRERILRLCSDSSPSAARYRQQVSDRAGTFRPSGFPGGPAIPLAVRMRSARRGTLLAGPAAAVLVVAVIVIAILASGGSAPSSNTAAAGRFSPSTAATATVPGTEPSTAPASSAPAGPGSKGATSPAAGVSSSPGLGLGTQGASTTAAPSHSPTHRASPSPSHSSPSPSRSPSHSPSPSPSPSPTTAAPGKLSLSAGAVQLSSGPNGGAPAGTLVMTAVGGPVIGWTITIPAGANGLLSASPSSGVLGSGQSVTVTFVLARPSSFSQVVTVNPGGVPVTVTFTPVGTESVSGAPLRE